MRKNSLPALALLALAGCMGRGNLVQVKNGSDEICGSITVSVCDSSWTIENLAPGETEEFTVVYTSDDHFQVIVENENGLTMEGNFGYVTHGINDETIEIIFFGDSLQFTQLRNNTY
ncbi:MAG: hypothetical protein KAH54_04545 [Candidatus Sabulitectum sp.]|nr:hypothetical protein [Candidatus Sabulitectum sp.]